MILRTLALVLSLAAASSAAAQDRLKVAIGQIDAWANQMPTLGMQAGIFQKHGIVLENFGTQGAGETLQAVISGSADIGIGIGAVSTLAGIRRRNLPGLPRYVQASRMVVQPATAARNNVIYLAWSNSTSLAFGYPTGG